MEPRALPPSSAPAYSLDMQIAGATHALQTPGRPVCSQAALPLHGPFLAAVEADGCSTHSVLTGTLGSAGTLRDGGSVNGERWVSWQPSPSGQRGHPQPHTHRGLAHGVRVEPAEVALVVDRQAFQKVCLETGVGMRPLLQPESTPGPPRSSATEGKGPPRGPHDL